MVTLAVALIALVSVVFAATMVAAAQRRGEPVSVERAAYAMLIMVAVVIVLAVLFWTFFLSKIHIG